ncbi:hypothetical protein V5O48_016505 [Marasmius crinis-equi]|uniref:DUF1772-domain-containing protein n=1 Tax=Marasmius crinis-equi TaxID=585013 RepID=A0ABR3ERK0_9AGAR
MSTGTGIRIAQALGIAGSTLLSAPALLTPSSFYSSTQAAIQWKDLYTRGARTMPPLAVCASSAYFYLAYKLHKYSRGLTQMYATAGILTLGIVPYTLLVMVKTNDELSSKAVDAPTEKSEVAKGSEVNELVERWSAMNLVRGLIPLTGSIVAIYATLF